MSPTSLIRVELRGDCGLHDRLLDESRGLPVVVETIAEHGREADIVELTAPEVEDGVVASHSEGETGSDGISIHQGEAVGEAAPRVVAQSEDGGG